MEKTKESLEEERKEYRNIKKEQEEQRLEIKLLHDEIAEIKEKTTQTTTASDLLARKNNVIIFGVIDEQEILKEDQMRNLVLTNRKIKGLLKSSAINLEETERNIVINEDLPKVILELFFKAKELKQLGYRSSSGPRREECFLRRANTQKF
ncbi:hypothetical protein HHI36_009899 [Cryptolaemus montrouzieri]|uniref:Uncharacterized protein n=1 Tax=Cryptolaemus montrouzieri TaxID=559131 RepID=A0ABD2MH41_9CUCU